MIVLHDGPPCSMQGHTISLTAAIVSKQEIFYTHTITQCSFSLHWNPAAAWKIRRLIYLWLLSLIQGTVKSGTMYNTVMCIHSCTFTTLHYYHQGIQLVGSGLYSDHEWGDHRWTRVCVAPTLPGDTGLSVSRVQTYHPIPCKPLFFCLALNFPRSLLGGQGGEGSGREIGLTTLKFMDSLILGKTLLICMKSQWLVMCMFSFKKLMYI